MFLLFLRQYKRPLVDLLLAAGALAFALGHRTDAWVILAIVTANASLGAFQEGRAERAIPALRRLATSTARVVHTWIGNRRLRSTPLSAELVIRHARLERSPPAVPERSALAAAPGGG